MTVVSKKDAKPRTESRGLSSTGVEHIAKLARLGLSEKEKQKYSKELSEILDYVEKLNGVELKNVDPVRSSLAEVPEGLAPLGASETSNGVEPTAQVTGLINVFRKDAEPREIDAEKIKKIIGQAPEREGNFVKTKAILEK